MTDKEYQKVMAYLEGVETDENGAYEEADYLNAMTELCQDEVLDYYLAGKKMPDVTYFRNKMDDYLDDFIKRCHPVGNEDPKYAFLKKPTKNGFSAKTSTDFDSAWRLDTAREMLEPKQLARSAASYYQTMLKTGQPIPADKKKKFLDLPIQKIATQYGEVFKTVFKVEKTDEELQALKASNPEEYQKAAMGKEELSKQTVAAGLTAYQAMKEKVENTGFFSKLFHLPSYLKMKKNTQKLKEQLLTKGIDEKTFGEFERGELKAKDAFLKNRLNKGEISKEDYDLMTAPLTKNRYAKAYNAMEDGKEPIENMAEHIDKSVQKIRDNFDALRGRKGGGAKKQADIKRWTEKYKKASANLANYNNKKDKRAAYYQEHYVEEIGNLEKSIPEAIKSINEDTAFINQMGMDGNEVKAWSNFDKNGLGPDGKPFTEKEKQLIDRCLSYAEKRQKLSEDQKRLHELKTEKAAADKMIKENEAAHEKDLKDFKVYSAKLAKVGALNSVNEKDEKSIETTAKLNRKLDVIEEVPEVNEEEDFRAMLAEDTAVGAEKRKEDDPTKISQPVTKTVEQSKIDAPQAE